MRSCSLKHRRRIWLLLVLLGLGLLPSKQGHSQTFEVGYQSYMRNQFPVAELQFRAALKKAKTKEDRAFILKFTGICQYMRGDKKAAAATFYEALGADKNVTVDEEEVLNPGVVSYFNLLRSKYQPPAEAAVPAKPAVTPIPAAKATVQDIPLPQAPAVLPAPTAERAKKKKKPALIAPAAKGDDNSRSFSWLHFMPFGAGQFYNGEIVFGSALAAAEVFTLYHAFDLNSRISAENLQNTEVDANPGITREAKDAFLLDNKNYIADLKREKNSSSAAFLALWTIGTIEALINAPKTHATEGSSTDKTSFHSNQKLLHSGWLPNAKGGTYFVQLSLKLH